MISSCAGSDGVDDDVIALLYIVCVTDSEPGSNLITIGRFAGLLGYI